MSESSDIDDSHWPVVAARAADAKGGADVVVLDVGPVLGVCGYFIITSASNSRLVRTIADEVEAQIAAAGGPRPIRAEGLDDLRWVLVDYGDFVLHVFAEETRTYYDLERLWSDVARVPWQDPDSEVAGQVAQ